MEEKSKIKLCKFLQWCQEHDIQSPKAELRYCGPEAGFGFFAKVNIRSNEPVIEVPKKMMVTSSRIVEEPDYRTLLSSNTSVKLEPFEIIILFFYLEHLKGPESMWHPYISMLPESFTTPLATGFDAALLPTQPRQLYEKQLSEVETMSSKLKTFIPNFDDSLFLWAWHVVNTRCIFYDNAANSKKSELIDTTAGDSIAVIPLMDMLNHDPVANCLPGFDKYSQRYRVTIGERMVMEDEQLYVCYGQHDNAKLWVEYGFRLPKNLFNHIPINLDLLLAVLQKIGFKSQSVNIDVAKEADFPCTVYGSEEIISYGLRKTCILLLMSSTELQQWQRIIYDEEYLEDESTLFQKSEELALKILKEISKRIESKKERADATVASLYSDQLEILNVIISASK